MKRKIIYVWNYREWGGAQIYFLSLMKRAKEEFEVLAMLPSDSSPTLFGYLEELGVRCDLLDPPPTSAPLRGFGEKIARRVAMLRSEKSIYQRIAHRDDLRDVIVHIDAGFWQSALLLWRLSRITNVLVTIHTRVPSPGGIRGFLWRTKAALLSRFSDLHLNASNNDALTSLEPYFGKNRLAGVEAAYSGFNLDEIDAVGSAKRDDVCRQYSLPSEDPILMSVGQFIQRKGCWDVLESLRMLKQNGSDATFVWIATGEPDEETKKRINEFGLGGSFVLLSGKQIASRSELLTLLGIADVFILASHQEGLPIALVEAMALGLPCIATNINAVPEAIENDRTGLLVLQRDPAVLKEAVEKLLADPALRLSLGKAARDTAIERFDESIAAEQTIKLYNSIWKSSE